MTHMMSAYICTMKLLSAYMRIRINSMLAYKRIQESTHRHDNIRLPDTKNPHQPLSST